MTGVFAILALVIQPFLPNSWEEIAKLFTIPLILATAFLVWRTEYIKLKPLFSLHYDLSNPISKTPVPDDINPNAYAFRLEVRSKSMRTTCCHGQLLSIMQPTGNKTSHQYIPLTFTPSVASKSLHPNTSIYIDILNVDSNNQISLPCVGTLPNGVAWGSLFSSRGHYFFRIQVVADEGVYVLCHLRFHWTGSWNTAVMEMVS